MDYLQTVQYLYNSLPMFQKVGGKAYKKGLDNVLDLCKHLGNPHDKITTIHVAGTNGKGSTCHMLSSVLQSAGYKTGLFTSPHLKSFTERFRINGKEVPEDFVVDFVAENKAYWEELQPSFFEMNVALAFHYFAKEGVDIAIIETGLGGRLDSTNIINPILSVITNISFDHTEILGDTLPLIAQEKAGIIKNKVPVVISEKQAEIVDVFIDKANQEEAPIYFASDFYSFKNVSYNAGSLVIEGILKHNKEYIDTIHSSLNGQYQIKNIQGVLMALEVLIDKGYQISVEDIKNGLADVSGISGLKGRWQVLSYNPLTICDTGHNESGIKAVVENLSRLQYNNLNIVLGLTKEKDLDKILSLLPKDAYYYFCNADLPRAIDAESLALHAMCYGLEGEVIADVNEAVNTAKEKAEPNDLIFIGGSTFVVAELESL